MTASDDHLGNNKRFTFTSAVYPDAGKFDVVNMTGFEAISKPFRFTLTLASKDADIDFVEMFEKGATFIIFSPDGKLSVPYHGVLAEFQQLQQNEGFVFYRAVLVPAIWRLSLYQRSDVYLSKTVPYTITSLLESNGLIQSVNFESVLIGIGRVRDFVCQYKETNLDFISRWMENEGIYFYFDHSGSIDKLKIGNNKSMHASDAVNVLYKPIDKLDTDNSVQDFVCVQKPVPRSISLSNFNPGKAGVELTVGKTIDGGVLGGVNLYGENYLDQDEGNRYALIRAEEIKCGSKFFTGVASAVGLRSGYFMNMSGHYRSSFNGNYLVLEVCHEGSQAATLSASVQAVYGGDEQGTTYSNTFRAIPADVQFRPERTTAKPRVTGTTNAFIDSSGTGNYADLDEAGRYLVRLPFVYQAKDVNLDLVKAKDPGKGSARIRMASPYAGSNHGMHFPLRKNTEVLLSFIDGDPDQPVILGAVPNSEHPDVVNSRNPYENNITTAGGNLFLMGDKPSKQEIWLHSPTKNTTLGMGSIATRDPESNTDASEASDPGVGKKILEYLIPPVSFRVSTAGSSDSLSGGSNTGVSRGRNYVSLQSDSTFTLLSSSRMAYKGVFDWTPQGEISFREDRIAIDRLDNFAVAHNIIRHAEDTVIIAAGRGELDQVGVKKLTFKAKVTAYTQLALTTALAVKDVVLVNISRECKDPLATPGMAKTISSPAFTALKLGFSLLMKSISKDIKKQKADTFHSKMVVNRGGLDLTAGGAELSITREEQGSPDLPDIPSTMSLAGLSSAVSNYVMNKPDPFPMGRRQTKLQIKNKVEDKWGDFTTITNTQNEISMKVRVHAGEHDYVCNEIHLNKEKAGIVMNQIGSPILFSAYKAEVTLKIDDKGIEAVNTYGSGNGQPYTTLSMVQDTIKVQAGISMPSVVQMSNESIKISTGFNGSASLNLARDSASLNYSGAGIKVSEAGVVVDNNGKLIKLG